MSVETDILLALNNTVRVEFTYNDEKRVVEPHVVGLTKDNRLMVRGYQVDGKSSSGRALPCWGLFEVSNIKNLVLTDRRFGVRLIEGYNSKDPVIVNNAVTL